MKKESLTRHKKIVHDGVKVKYPCKQCDQEFTQKGNLARHQMAVHEGAHDDHIQDHIESGHNGQNGQNGHNGCHVMVQYGHKYGRYWCLWKEQIIHEND